MPTLGDIMDNIKLININGNQDLITKGVLFDDEHTCYHDYSDFNDIIIGFMLVADNYGIFNNDEFIGLISIFPHYYKDTSRLEISISIKSEYRNKKIGKYSLKHKDTYKKDKKRIKKLIKAFEDENLKDFIDFDCLEEDIYED